MPEEKLKILHNTLSQEYDLGEYEKFATKMQDPEKRRIFYNTVGQDYELGNYDEFLSKIRIHKKPETFVSRPDMTAPEFMKERRKIKSDGKVSGVIDNYLQERQQMVSERETKDIVDIAGNALASFAELPLIPVDIAAQFYKSAKEEGVIGIARAAADFANAFPMVASDVARAYQIAPTIGVTYILEKLGIEEEGATKEEAQIAAQIRDEIAKNPAIYGLMLAGLFKGVAKPIKGLKTELPEIREGRPTERFAEREAIEKPEVKEEVRKPVEVETEPKKIPPEEVIKQPEPKPKRTAEEGFIEEQVRKGIKPKKGLTKDQMREEMRRRVEAGELEGDMFVEEGKKRQRKLFEEGEEAALKSFKRIEGKEPVSFVGAQEIPGSEKVGILVNTKEGSTVLYRKDQHRVVQGISEFQKTLKEKDVIESQEAFQTEMKAGVKKMMKQETPALKSIKRVTDVGKEETEKAVTKEQIVKDLSKSLDVPIRTGQFRSGRQKKLGIFKEKPEVIRTRIANDIEVIAHEYGHALQKYLFGRFNVREGRFVEWAKEHGIDKKKVVEELKALDYEPEKARTSEGFAEFIRQYINGEEAAKKSAPEFFKAFEERMQAEPEIQGILLKARRDWQRWRDQPAVAQVHSQISINEKERSLPNFTDIYTYSVDDLHPLKKVVEELNKKQPIETRNDPYILARLMRGWGGKVEHYFQKGQLNTNLEIIGDPLNKILKPIEKNMDNFRDYSISKKALELKEKFPEKDMIELTGFTEEAARQTVNELKSDVFDKALKDVHIYRNNLLKYAQESGLFDLEEFNRIRQSFVESNVPFYRKFEEKKGFFGLGEKPGDVPKPVKPIRGSGLPILDPIESLVKDTYTFINLSERNRIGLALADLSKIEKSGKYVERVPIPMELKKYKAEDVMKELEKYGVELENAELLQDVVIDMLRPQKFRAAENHIFVYRDGKREYYRLHPELYKSVMALNREQIGWLVKILSIPARWLRAGATLTPEFTARNPVRDNFPAYVYSKYGFKPGFDFVKSIFSIAKKDEFYWDFKASGADHSMLVSMDRNYLQDISKELLKTRTQKVFKGILNPMYPLRKASEYFEMGTRLGEFRRGLKAEGRDITGKMKSAYAAREVTLDFSRKGAKARELNRIIAFFNAQVQGIDKMLREFKTKPFKSTIKSLIGITIPSISLYLINRDDESYKRLPRWQKDLFWIIPMPEQFKKVNLFGDNYLRIPKPFELGLIFGSLPERILEYIDDKDPEALEDFAKSFYESIFPTPIPTAVKPLIDNYANYNQFFDMPIVPRQLEEIEPYLQYTDFTSESAKAIGKLINYPPAKIDNLFYGYFGGTGRIVTNYVTDPVLRGLKGLKIPEEPEKGLADWPLIKGFIARNPTSSLRNIRRFYDEYKKVKTAYFTNNYLEKNNPEKAEEYYLKNDVLISQYSEMKEIADILRDLRAEVNAIYESEIDKKEKTKQINQIYYFMDDLVKSNLEAMGK